MTNLYIHDEVTHNKKAASIIVPILCDLLDFKTVLDVGCGTGTWLSVFQENGSEEVLGLDGDHLDKRLFAKNVSLKCFQSVDLKNGFDLNKKFDLVVCLEVAEHLPSSSEDSLVSSLCRHSNQIVFSAAIPGQGGQNHINEQWLSYWIEKFKRYDFQVFDILRPKIWENNNVENWYRQNIVLFRHKSIAEVGTGAIDMVLPEYWNQKTAEIEALKLQLNRIKEGKVGASFYLKSILKTLKYFGKRVD